MAIFGNLQQISLADLMPLLKSQRGSLEIFNLDGQQPVTLYVDGGRLVALYVGGKPVEDIVVRSVMNSLMAAKRGSFEFVPGVSPRHRHPNGWDLDRLMLSVVTIADEMEEAESRLPHLETVFRLSSPLAPDDVRVHDFWERARHMLASGASAKELSHRLGLSPKQTGFYLLKLRQAGLIEPVRVSSRRRSRPGLAGKLLGALKRRFIGA